jgi:hypothetical protein
VGERTIPLNLVDGRTLPSEVRDALRPGEVLRDRDGRGRRLPRFFYEVDSWQTARETVLAPNFRLSELIMVDVREHPAVRGFPKYVPCAVALLGAHLQLFREKVGTFVYVAVNGGYRSPGHHATRYASTHCWGTAVNIYRIGDDFLDEQERIERYGGIAAKLTPALTNRPYGHTTGFADDHLHLDLGYVTVTPVDAAEDLGPEPADAESLEP